MIPAIAQQNTLVAAHTLVAVPPRLLARALRMLFLCLPFVLLWGCSGPKQTQESEEDFFVPVDTLNGGFKPLTSSGAQQGEFAPLQTDSVGLVGTNPVGQGMAQQGGNDNGEFAPLLTGEVFSYDDMLSPAQLRDSLNMISSQVSFLQTVLEGSTIDPKMYQNAQVKAWIISNPALRDSLFYALMNVDSSIQSEAGADAEMLATEQNDLIEARFGTSIFKGLTLKNALEKSSDSLLYKKIIENGAFSKDVELRDSSFALPTPLEPELMLSDVMFSTFVQTKFTAPRQDGMADLSLYRLAARYGPNWGAAIKLGDDQLGFPFWTLGDIAFLGTYRQIEAGFVLPLAIGLHAGDNFPIFPLKNRLLNGTRGFFMSTDQGTWGASFSSTRLTSSDLDALTNPNNFYYMTGSGIGYYSFSFSLNNQNFMRLKIGGGYDVVHESYLNNIHAITDYEVDTHYNPYINMDYVHQTPDEHYGASVQVFDLNMLFTGWLEVMPNFLRIEVKYSQIISRPVRPYENPDFIIISPRFRLEF